MTWSTLTPFLAQGGIVGMVLWIVYRLHQDAIKAVQTAVQSEQRRADDARARAEAAEKRADLREQQMGILLGSRDKEPTP